MKKIYIACPYGHLDPFIKLIRTQLSEAYQATLLNQGYNAISPISGHYMCQVNDVDDSSIRWLEINRQIVEICDEIHILMLKGWDKSTGIQNTIDQAKELGMKVKMIDPEDLWLSIATEIIA